MPRKWPFLLVFMAVISAFAGTAFAQDNPDMGKCLMACADQLKACDEGRAQAECATLPECEGVSLGESSEGLGKFCQAYCDSGHTCFDNVMPGPPTPQPPSSPSPQPPSAPQPGTQPTPQPQRPPLTEEQKCRQRGGVWVEVVDVIQTEPELIAKTHFECKSLQGIYEMHKQLRKDHEELKKRVDMHDNLLMLLQLQLDRLSKAQGIPGWELTVIMNDLAQVNQRLDGVVTRVTVLEGENATQNTKLKDHEERLDSLESQPPGEASSGGAIGFYLGAFLGDLHVVKPFDELMWGVGPEAQIHMAFVRRWRFVLGLGAGFAGENHEEDDVLKVITAQLGFQHSFVEDFRFAFGGIISQRFDQFDTEEFGSYGAYVEPKLYPGVEENRLSIGLRAAFVTTVFANSPLYEADTKVYATPNGSFSLTIGYVYDPAYRE